MADGLCGILAVLWKIVVLDLCDANFFLQGEVLGITRFGLAKMKESVLMLASVSHHLLLLTLSTLSTNS